jgi:hypothetical protein
MLGYALFLVPMAIAYGWVSWMHGGKQALLDLLAFNLMFNFDFAALLPNNTNLLLLHVLLIAFIGVEILGFLVTGNLRLTWRTLLVFAAVGALLLWLSMAIFVNKLPVWGVSRTLNYIVRGYLLNALFIIVGVHLAKSDRLERFGKIFLIAGAVSGMIAIVQTVSNGALLTNDKIDNYLGIFQPLGDKAIGRRDQAESVINYLEIVKTIHFGDISFYRASAGFDGSYISFCIIALISLCLLISRDKHTSRWLFIPITLSIAGFVAAFSRTAIITFVFLSFCAFLVQFRSVVSHRVLGRWVIPLAVAGLIVLSLAAPIANVVAANFDGLLGSRAGREVGTLNGRSSLWSYVVSEAWRSPIIGSGKSITLYRAGWGVDDNPDVDISAHNSFLEFAYRGGLVPALLFTLLFCFCLVRAWRLSRSRLLSPHKHFLFFVLFITTASMGILNMTASMITVPQFAALFWILCGYLATYRSAPSSALAPRSDIHGSFTSQPVG